MKQRGLTGQPAEPATPVERMYRAADLSQVGLLEAAGQTAPEWPLPKPAMGQLATLPDVVSAFGVPLQPTFHQEKGLPRFRRHVRECGSR